MKKFTYLIISIMVLAFFGACKQGVEVQVDENFHPRIIDNAGVFTAPSRIINEGESAIYNGLMFSPKPIEKTQVIWTVNDVEVSRDTTYTFTPTAGGEYVLKLEASYNGKTSTRISKILVSPSSYTPKNYTHVAMAYLSENGKAIDVDWTKVTHVAFNGARVVSGESVDFTNANLNQNIDEIVARAHVNGVPVLLGVSGRLSGLDGGPLYGSSDFGDVISNATARASLVNIISTYITNRKIDGVDLMMTDYNNDVYARNLQALTPFISELKAALPTGSLITVTVAVGWQHWDYTSLLEADWLNVRAFENGAIGPGTAKEQQSTYDFMVNASNIWLNKGYPASKIVLGIPAFGLRYLELDGNGNNLGWGSYNYLPYKEIIRLDPTAPEKEYSDLIAQGVYYNGAPLVTQKANYIKNNNFKGAYLWALDYDAAGPNSLMAILDNILN